MILKNWNSQGVDSDLLAGRQKKFKVKQITPNARSETEVRCQQKLCCKNEILSKNSCRAQQRLINLTKISKVKEEQPKLPTNSSIQEKSLDPKPFIYKVRNYEHIKAIKPEGKLSNAIFIHNGSYEYYPKDPIYDRDFTVIRKIQNNEKLNENSIKEKLNNASQTSDTDLKLLYTVDNINEKNKNDCKSNNKFGNVIVGNSENIKETVGISCSSENDQLCVINPKSNSEKKDLADNTLTSFQQWFFKNEPSVSILSPENKHTTAKTRPLKISEALNLHRRENAVNHNHEIDGDLKNLESKDNLFSSIEDDLSKFENIKIAELHENFLVENLETPMKSAHNICAEDKADFNKRSPDYNNDSPKSNDFSKNGLPRKDFDSFKNRKHCNDHQRFTVSTSNLKKDFIQKNILTNSRNSDNNSRNLLCSNNKTNSKNNRINSLSGKYNSIETKNNPKATSISSSDESLLYSSRNSSFASSKDSFMSEEASFKDLKQCSNENYSKESHLFTKDKQFSRMSENTSLKRDSFSKLHNCTNDKRFSDSSLPTKDYSNLNKLPNSKAISSKLDATDLSQKSLYKLKPWSGFQQRKEVPNERYKISSVRSMKDLLKEYNTSNQLALKYAKSCSDFDGLVKSRYEYTAGKGATRTSSCLAQQRLLCCKALSK